MKIREIYKEQLGELFEFTSSRSSICKSSDIDTLKASQLGRMPNKIVILLGSVRPGRLVDRVGTAVKNIVTSEGLEPVVLDPLEFPFDVLKVPLHWMKDPETNAPEWMKEVNEKIKSADGFIVVSAEYNCGIPPALSNMLDHFSPASFRHRPCGIVTYSPGTYGGVRASVVLRPFLSEIGLVTTPAFVSIPQVTQSVSEDGTPDERISKNLTKLVQEVAWYATAIQNHKANVPPPQ